ncbi:glycosyltransferase 87 family protein [Streptomyces sp. NPDC096012]|uniref:glycosyltransferase 87 family protein n=1 Tax=Streptomyces sp. NPDC096012 TaxID=3155684 RepID=UPI00336A7E2F
MADLLVYRAEGAAVAHGHDLYGFTVTRWQLPATYPPFAAILFVPATWLPVPALKAAFLAGNTLLLVLLIALSARLAARPAPLAAPSTPLAAGPTPLSAGPTLRSAPSTPLPTPLLCAAAALSLWLEPVFQTLLFGQINLALTCLVLWDLTRPPTARGKGVALGIAAGIKLTPAVFVPYLFLTGRRREALTAAAACAGTAVLGGLLLPAASADFWTRRLYETGRVGKVWIVDNQSLQGLLARALRDPAPGLAWALPAAAVGAAGLWLAVRAGEDRHGIPLTAFTALLISPISWSHHWVWCVPLIAVLLGEGRIRLAALTATAFTARTFWLLPHQGDRDLHFPWWQQPLASPYALLGLALLAGAPVLGRRARQPVPSARISSASTIR